VTIQQAAWQKRSDVVDVDWKELWERYDYPHATILGGCQNVSHRTAQPFWSTLKRAAVLTVLFTAVFAIFTAIVF